MTIEGQIAFWQRARDEHRARQSVNRNARACHARRTRLRAAGLCIFCGDEPAATPSPLCAGCRAEQSAVARERYLALRAQTSVRRYRRRKGGQP